MLSASAEGLTIGNHVHLGVGCYIFGAGGAVTFEDFSGLSARVSLFTSTDDFTEGYLTNPTVPNQYRRVTSGPIHLHQHVIIGSGAVILPNVTLEYGSAVGALTLVQKSVSRGTIVSGNPARVIPLSRNVNRLQELQHQCLQDPSA
ncbi:acyltransferase [bacterium]|nr:acyltransferase [bacterium]